MNAFSLPKATEEEKKMRTDAIQLATTNATQVPFKVMELSYSAFEIIKAMAEIVIEGCKCCKLLVTAGAGKISILTQPAIIK